MFLLYNQLVRSHCCLTVGVALENLSFIDISVEIVKEEKREEEKAIIRVKGRKKERSIHGSLIGFGVVGIGMDRSGSSQLNDLFSNLSNKKLTHNK